MAGPYDPFNPETAGASPVPNDQQIQSQLGTMFQNPAVLGALLSTGLAMSQPPSFGDTGFSHFGRAIGAAGESARLTDAQAQKERELQIKEEESGSKQDLRGAQAEAAIARSGTQEARTTAAADRLRYLQGETERKTQMGMLGNRIRTSLAYQKYVGDTAKQNQQGSLLTPNFRPAPVLPFEDWKKANNIVELDTSNPAPAQGSDTSDQLTPGPSGYAQAPTDPSARQDGMMYDTPRGPLKWDARRSKWIGQ